MYAKWIAEDFYVGPKSNQSLAIAKGEIRRIHGKNHKNQYILEGKDGKGFFGWIDGKNIEVLEVK